MGCKKCKQLVVTVFWGSFTGCIITLIYWVGGIIFGGGVIWHWMIRLLLQTNCLLRNTQSGFERLNIESNNDSRYSQLLINRTSYDIKDSYNTLNLEHQTNMIDSIYLQHKITIR